MYRTRVLCTTINSITCLTLWLKPTSGEEAPHPSATPRRTAMPPPPVPAAADPPLQPVPLPAPMSMLATSIARFPLWLAPPAQHPDVAVDRMMDFLDVIEPPPILVEQLAALVRTQSVALEAIRRWWPLCAVHVTGSMKAQLDDEALLGRPVGLPILTNWLGQLPRDDSRTQLAPKRHHGIYERRRLADEATEHYWNRERSTDTSEEFEVRRKRARVHIVSDADINDMRAAGWPGNVWVVPRRASTVVPY